jgi:hypothetical protein
MPRVRFEPTALFLNLGKTVHVLDRTATVIVRVTVYLYKCGNIEVVCWECLLSVLLTYIHMEVATHFRVNVIITC